MDDNNRNLILAMVLSALVMVGWYAFFAPPPPEPTDPAVATQTAPGAIAPTAPAEQAPAPTLIGAADDPVLTAPRVQIESPSMRGSISLAGGRIDDILLTGYRETLDPASPFVRLLSPTAQPRVTEEGTPAAPATEAEVVIQKPYYAVYGWTPGPGVDPALVPNPATVWTAESGQTLAPGQPVTLVWDNGAGQVFRRTFALDDRYLFTVTQSVENTGPAPFVAAPYGILARHGQPDTQNFFILHEGAVGMTDGELVEVYPVPALLEDAAHGHRRGGFHTVNWDGQRIVESLRGGHAHPQPGERPRPDADGDARQVCGRHVGFREHRLDRGCQDLGVTPRVDRRGARHNLFGVVERGRDGRGGGRGTCRLHRGPCGLGRRQQPVGAGEEERQPLLGVTSR